MPDLRGGIRATRTIYLMPIKGLTSGNVIPSRGFWFPVAPSSYTVTGNAEWQSNRIVGLGEVSHRAGENLKQIEIESFFPGENAPGLTRALRSDQDFYDPDDACALLEKVMNQQIIFQLNIGGGEIFQDKCRLTEFAWTEVAGRPNDRGFSCRFETWKPQQITRRGEVVVPPIPKAYKLREGEDLEDAALRIYGDIRKAPAIAAYNGVQTVAKAAAGAGQTLAKTTKGVGKPGTAIIPKVVKLFG